MATAPAPTQKKPTSDQKRPPVESMTYRVKLGHEIEEIFQGKKKRKEPTSQGGGEQPKKKKKFQKNLKRREQANQNQKKKKGILVDDRPEEDMAKQRRTGDGLLIYSAEELGFGNLDSGGTPLCPFDCSCCF